MTTAIWRVSLNGQESLARGAVELGPQELLPPGLTLTTLLGGTEKDFASALRVESAGPVPSTATILAPVTDQEIWAAGVTYERSREARREESKIPDLYERVYVAERPEVFFKSSGSRVRGNGQPIGIRADSTWDVPEPELALVVNSGGRIVACTIGNDVSSRSIEGENALYLPQAKYYTGSCSIGPCLVPISDAPPISEMIISLTITRDGGVVFDDKVSVARMKRTPDELVDWLFRAQSFPEGVILLTGTGLVPGNDFTLQQKDHVSIEISGLGRLQNTVERVGR